MITSVKSHPQTMEILRDAANALPGKTVIELSTGGATKAEELAQFLEDAGAEWMFGIINAYPHMIGNEDTVLSVVSTEKQWVSLSPIIKSMGLAIRRECLLRSSQGFSQCGRGSCGV